MVTPSNLFLLLHYRDPFVYGMALTLKQELETDYNGCRLYAESLLEALNVHLLRKYATIKPQIKDYSNGLAPHKLRLILNLINGRCTNCNAIDRSSVSFTRNCYLKKLIAYSL